jgi:hypothetical protein
MMILTLLGFIRNMLSSMMDKNKRHLIKSELENTKVETKSFDNIL